MENNWPETTDELVEECEKLISRFDLYTLGEKGEPFAGEDEPRVDGAEYLAGEYQYGVAMIPAQWVTHVVEAATLGSGTCEFTLEYDRDEVERRKKMYEEEPFGLFPQDMPDSAWTCSNCGQQFKCHYDRQTGKLLPVPDWMKCCPSCGFKIRKAVSE